MELMHVLQSGAERAPCAAAGAILRICNNGLLSEDSRVLGWSMVEPARVAGVRLLTQMLASPDPYVQDSTARMMRELAASGEFPPPIHKVYIVDMHFAHDVGRRSAIRIADHSACLWLFSLVPITK